jgi:hypothetical protein
MDKASGAAESGESGRITPAVPGAPGAPDTAGILASRPSSSASVVPAVILTAVLALAVGVAGTLAIVTRGEAWLRLAEGVVAALLWMLAGALVLLLLGAPLAFLALRRLWREAVGSVNAVVTAGEYAARAWGAGDRQRAIAATSRVAEEAAAWWARGALRRWMAGAAVALLAAFGPILGALLVLRQTALLEAQNTLIEGQTGRLDQQTITADAARRNAALNPELLELLRDVAKLSGEAGMNVPSELTARIVAFLNIAEPYLYLRPKPADPALNASAFTLASPRRPLSPERGALLAALARRRVDLGSLVRAGGDFSHADLAGANLSGFIPFGVSRSDAFSRTVLAVAATIGGRPGLNLSGASLSRADLSGAHLFSADLSSTDLRLAKLEGAWIDVVPAVPSEPSPGGAAAAPRPDLPSGWERGPPDGWVLEFRGASAEGLLGLGLPGLADRWQPDRFELRSAFSPERRESSDR